MKGDIKPWCAVQVEEPRLNDSLAEGKLRSAPRRHLAGTWEGVLEQRTFLGEQSPTRERGAPADAEGGEGGVGFEDVVEEGGVHLVGKHGEEV